MGLSTRFFALPEILGQVLDICVLYEDMQD